MNTRTFIEELQRISLEAAAETFRTGFCMAPQVHLFYEPEDEYVGYVSCREYYRGQDAVAAIGHLGVIAAAMCATRLLVVWEESDLRTSIYGPPPHSYPNGLAMLEVSLTEHQMTWYPFTSTIDYRQLSNPTPAFDIHWARPSVQENVELLPGIRDLIGLWRTEMISSHEPTWVADVTSAATVARYTIHAATQSRTH